MSVYIEYIDELRNQFSDKVKMHSVLFLRKDIFRYILRNIRESDKVVMNTFEINWEKFPQLLKTVINKRIQNILEIDENIDKIWQDYFSIKKGKDVFEYIQSFIVNRPRDAIYFMSRLFESAATNNKSQVTDADMNYALEEYTKYLYENLIAELKAEFPMVDKILRELQRVYAGILTQFTFIPIENFNKIIKKYLNKEEADKFIKVLIENNYLVAVIKRNNVVLNDYEDLNLAINERKFRIFKKNKILFNMKLIPFAE